MTARRAATLPGINPVRLLAGFLAGPVLWSLHLLISEILVSASCSQGQSGFMRFTIGPFAGWQLVLLLVTVAFVLLIVAANLIALGSWRRSEDPEGITGIAGGAPGRSSWLSLAGILLSTLFLIGILAGGIPAIWLSGCV
jgi:hypothetical protein